ncbi:MAG: hypothetical protein IJ422_03705 [Oscillospiraceae bacterium]|nr:hypothetical protein [Oscillospiraceae bacterium]
MGYEMINPAEQGETLSQPEVLEEGILREIIGQPEQYGEMPEQTEAVVGDLEDVENWHPQAEQYSCTVSVQELIAEQLLDRDVSESAMIDYAEKMGWYDPAEGASKADTGKLLEMLGFDVERAENVTVSDLVESLSEGEKIICAVDNMALQQPEYAGLPGRTANHVVQVVAIDFSDPENPQVILNDTGVPNGQGIRHDLDVFLAAWKSSGNFAVMVDQGGAA